MCPENDGSGVPTLEKGSVMQVNLEQWYVVEFCVKLGRSASEILELGGFVEGLRCRLHGCADGTRPSRKDEVLKTNNDQDAPLCQKRNRMWMQ